MMSPVPYLGSKGRLAREIARLLPPHRTYIEPFAGSAAVLMAKRPAPLEVLNDLDGRLVTFWRILRDQPDELLRVCASTPYSRAEFDSCELVDGLDDIEVARRVWVRLQQSFTHTTRSSGWSMSSKKWPSQAHTVRSRLDRLGPAAERLAAVVLESRPAIELLEQHSDNPDAVIYCDPPYMPSVRRLKHRGSVNASDYSHEMTLSDHAELAEALHRCRGTVVLSGYPSPEYAEWFGDWQTVEWDVSVHTAHHRTTGRRRALETVWINRPNPQLSFEECQ